MDGLQRLRAQLDAELPPKSVEKSMLLATWNIREFDSPAYGDRISDAFYYIANSGWSELDDHGDLKPGFKLTPAHIMRFVAE